MADQERRSQNRCVDGIVAQVHRLEHEFHRTPTRHEERCGRRVDRVDLRQERLDLLGIRRCPHRGHHTQRMGHLQLSFEGTHLAAEQSDLTHPQSGQIPLDPAEEGEVQVAVAVGHHDFEHHALAGLGHVDILTRARTVATSPTRSPAMSVSRDMS